MSLRNSAIYRGIVIHKRLRPTKHQLRYRVFALLLDLNALDELSRRCFLFSRNRFNIFSFYDRDHVPTESLDIESFIRGLLRRTSIDIAAGRIQILCYPRILGYVFNPLTLYFCYDVNEKLIAIVYEVNNTFQERRCYVIPINSKAGSTIDQSCPKELYVSPFNACEGQYNFQITAPNEQVSVSIDYENEEGTILKAYFKGTYRSFGDFELAKLLLIYPFMTLKVTAGIYFEAARLWLKGLPIIRHKRSSKFAVSIVSKRKGQEHG